QACHLPARRDCHSRARLVQRPQRNRLTMKTRISILLLAGVAIAAALFAGCSKSGPAQSKTYYTCGMHPQVIQDHPGNCPICGMKLTPVRKQDGNKSATNSSFVAVDPVTRQNMGIRTETVTRG